MRLLDNLIFLVGAFVSGLFFLAMGLYVLFRLATRLAGRGEAYDLEERAARYWNDIAEAAAPLRTLFQFGFGAALTGGFMIWASVLGRRVLDSDLAGWWIAVIAFMWLWAVIERWFAWPGLFIVPEARGTKGVFFARRAEKRAVREGMDDGTDGADGSLTRPDDGS
ncbi:hypothetical protein [Myceligenerans salitolerans]|uniref:Uncharacterized protein n=1 Tax=Myceligenerans salitolerans TaxID=1230528 RepID=A0ABS3I6U9_9MICO|nr:hypothetical protein [Myceligenerans salitolerans]MBO0608726.1 hypothetical protein [Myceligenerans salitolerans]